AGQLHRHLKGEGQVGRVRPHDVTGYFGAFRTEIIRAAAQFFRHRFGNDGVRVGFETVQIDTAAGQHHGVELVDGDGRRRRRALPFGAPAGRGRGSGGGALRQRGGRGGSVGERKETGGRVRRELLNPDPGLGVEFLLFFIFHGDQSFPQ